MPTARERKQDAKAALKKVSDDKWERKKFWVPIIISLLGFAGIICQLNSQSNLKHEEFEFQKEIEFQKFEFQKQIETQKLESQLLFEALNKPDKDTLLRKFISLGFLNDNSKKYSFLLYDTIIVRKTRSIEYGDTIPPVSDTISTWDAGHVKNFCNCVEGSNFQFIKHSNGEVEFSFDIESQKSLEKVTPTLTIVQKGITQYSFDIQLPSITIPAYKYSGKKRVIYMAYDKRIKDSFKDIIMANTNWDCESSNN